jgi:hypothetical protein
VNRPHQFLRLQTVQNLVRKIKEYITPDRHNSGTPGAISTKLGTHMSVCMYKIIMYFIYIYRYIYEWVYVRF